MNGGRGMVFPYKLAHTNNPTNYKVACKGDWKYCINTQANRSCPVGLMGMSVSTCDKTASITINPNNDKQIEYRFCRVRVFHSMTHYKLTLLSNGISYSGSYDTLAGFTLFQIPDAYVMKIQLNRPDSIQETITLYGISLENDDPGIVYNAIGVNGAKLNSYLSCEYYSQQLAALDPDLIIFSIGTNVGNTREFNPSLYGLEYLRLIEISKIAAPTAAILITVPNDCYLYKKYVNTNTALMRGEIFKLAADQNYGVWDFYSVMGGLNSSEVWHKNNLIRDDRIHFTQAGYILKGDLFVDAFLKAWEKNLEIRTAKTIFLKNSTIQHEISTHE
jgi:lysophospholipase L1-like esterase